MSETEPSQAERLAFVKFARSSAVAADKLCATLYALTQKLEEQKLIDPNRPSKRERDNKLRKNARELAASDEQIDKLVKQISEKNSDAEKIVASLFRDATPRKAKKTNDNKKQEDAN